MKYNLIAIVAYPISLILVGSVAIKLFFDLEKDLSIGFGTFLYYSPFLISGIISGWLAVSGSIRTAIYGSLILPILCLVIYPFTARLFSNLPESQIKSVYISIIFLLPFILLLSVVGGFIGSKLRILFKKLYF